MVLQVASVHPTMEAENFEPLNSNLGEIFGKILECSCFNLAGVVVFVLLQFKPRVLTLAFSLCISVVSESGELLRAKLVESLVDLTSPPPNLILAFNVSETDDGEQQQSPLNLTATTTILLILTKASNRRGMFR
ncbi:uncharacterized protein LOC126597511 [Malus sylvestris]|uniref:uncharacterized protein LOC126597511 n=1 Tax=Malus sylvestris TaxID=3752 RepID=UPI0021ABE52C|nr:uncharacterized protein LOC126597511 [Malus sylvestris]